ncbi:MAG: DNA polymerase III subunit alpha, partial [Flavobacteriaceae bacterium]|nr:DNA polymerase III subunit alpha [Flavobacteriaceae bacterium]
EPKVPPCEEWGTMEKLAREKEVVGIYISGHPLDDFKIEMDSFCNTKLSELKNLERFINREVCFGGVVTDIQHRVSRQGKGWAAFTMEDYEESMEFRIFGEEYLKYRHFLVKNSFVYIKIFVKEGWTNRDTGQKGDPRIQFNHFSMLQDVMDKYAKKLSVQLDISDLQEKRITILKDLFKSHKGDSSLNFVVYDHKDAIKLQMPARKQKVKISQELINELQELDIHYRLN